MREVADIMEMPWKSFQAEGTACAEAGKAWWVGETAGPCVGSYDG